MRSHCCLSAQSAVVARQQLGKNFPATMNTRATIEEMLDASCQCLSVRVSHSIFITRFVLSHCSLCVCLSSPNYLVLYAVHVVSF
jgi:hypothetical protein